MVDIQMNHTNKLLDFLLDRVGHDISRDVYIDGLATLFDIATTSRGMMPLPSIATHSGMLFYTWDDGRHHLSIDFKEGKKECFYHDRDEGYTWFDTTPFKEPLSRIFHETTEVFSTKDRP